MPVLDAADRHVVRWRDLRTAGETMLLLNMGETLEEYTRSRSEGALVSALLDLPETAQLVEDDQEIQVAASTSSRAITPCAPACPCASMARWCAAQPW
ncbi:MAG: hypothetical protein ACLTMP_12475 [Eggerthella lenta]